MTGAAGHEKSSYQFGSFNYYWIALMARYEWPALLGLFLCFTYILRSEARLRYLGIYGCGVLLAYSFIPYKTPWCVISILWPFYFLLGAFATAATKFFGYDMPAAVAKVVLMVSLAASAFASIRLNFYQFTNEREPYVYVQTFPEIQVLTKPLLEMAGKDPRYYHLQGHILLDSYYPLPWMLGDFTRIGYYKKDEPPEPLDADFVVTYDNGTRGGKAEELALAASFNQQIDDSALEDFTIRLYGNTAVVQFTLHLLGPIQGKPVEIVYRYIDVWVLREASWRCVASQSTRVTAPRDAPAN